MVTKAYILQEIKRTAEENGGKPLGSKRFEAETGIKSLDWQHYWYPWSNALHEAGFLPNELNRAYDAKELLGRYAKLAVRLGHLPSSGELRFEARNVQGFPAHNTFHRLGAKTEFVERLLKYCQSEGGYDEVVRMCQEYAPRRRISCDEPLDCREDFGFVYLIKSGRFYKIGKAKDADYRVGAIRLQLPEKAKRIHVIRTDDPGGIEAYWHKRFETKRKNGEWFELDANDIAAFKRRKFQ
jgi:hypothetical protein